MRKILLVIAIFCFGFLLCKSAEPDIIVTHEGESLKVYNLEISSNFVFYTLKEDIDDPVEKISKKDILIIKKVDGTILKLNECISNVVNSNQPTMNEKDSDVYETVTYMALELDFVFIHHDKTKNNIVSSKKKYPDTPAHDDYYILAGMDDNSILNFRLLSHKDKTLSVTKPRKSSNRKTKNKKLIYDGVKYVIPEYVKVGTDTYTVTEIDSLSFYGSTTVEEIIFPSMLIKIGDHAFRGKRVEKAVGYDFESMNLKKLILPEGLKEIGMFAFFRAGGDIFEQLYIPKSVEKIGEYAFGSLGPKTSYRGYFQGNLTCIPDFITIGNCTSYGIDEEAMETYEKRQQHNNQ